jgi:hypothetical protein
MRAFIVALLVALMTALIAAPAVARSGKSKTTVVVTKKYHGTRGHGFLPGYEAPASARRIPFGESPYVRDATWPWYGWPGFHRGRWNGGGFGPCYTKTPIGPVWNCG